MKYVRHITSVLIIILIAVLAAGTVVEKLHGSDFALAHVYSAWWFVGLWALVAIMIVIMIAKCRLWKRLSIGALHLSILLIMLGALLTMLTGQHGRMKLEPNKPNSHFFIQENGEITEEALPFSLTLDRFEIETYSGSNKPKDYVTTSDDPQQRKTVMDLVKNACPERIYPVGRLDRNTTGVLLLTNDGDLASKLTHPKYLKKKIYHVYLDKNVTAHDLQQITEGIQLDDGEIKADDVQYAHPTDKKQVGIEIHSGRNRIVRRIFEALGYRVQKLDRVQFAGLTKKNLKRGDWRYLTEEEVDRLRMGAYE